MATYAETLDTDALFVATEYDLYLAPGPSTTYIEVAESSDNPTRFVVTGIPAGTRPVEVAQRLRQITIWRHPDILMWSAVADLRPGALVRAKQDGRVVSVSDDKHWSGRRCIGWMRDENV